MKISYNWIKQFISIDWDVEKAGELLTDLGLEVEGIEKYETIKGGLEGVVVGHVLTCDKHPNADKLSVTTVDLGNGEPVQIVCGAPNVAAGQKVPVATVGTTLYDGDESFKIKKGKIRGEVSLGMICAEDELGLGHSHDGIMVLDEALVPGTPCAEVFDIDTDYTIEIGLTPNRADSMSHWGVARDLVAGLKQQGVELNLCKPTVDEVKVAEGKSPVKVVVEDQDKAPRYAGLVIDGLKVAESPEWLQHRLKAIGLSPINNVVDITNYVLHELGQPLHAFDMAAVKGNEVHVKTVAAGTKFTTLDDVERSLDAEDLMICNAEEPMCIAGVFGGSTSGVSDSTTSIFLESAYFNPVAIRKAAKRHALNTDASFRFERGIDPNITVYALKYAAKLITEIAGGEIVSDITDIYPEPIQDFEFEIKYPNIDRLIGMNIPRETVNSILNSLEIEILEEAYDSAKIRVPAYRVDVQREADIIEDILRVYGYNNVPISEKLNTSIVKGDKFNAERINNMSADLLVNSGYNEMMSNSLTKAEYTSYVDEIKEEREVKILNPLSTDLGVMRQSLLFGGLEAIARNINHKNADLRLFEFGKTYHKYEQYEEYRHLALFLTGNKHNLAWNQAERGNDFYDLRGAVNKLTARLGLKDLKVKPAKSEVFTDGIGLYQKKTLIVELGQVKKALLKKFDIKQDVFFADFNWDNVLAAVRNHKIVFEELPKFPAVRRDLALLLNKDVQFADLYAAAFQSEKNLLKEVDLFDVYEGDKLPEGKKSYALSFVLQDANKTLTDKQIDKVMSKMQKTMERQFEAELRS